MKDYEKTKRDEAIKWYFLNSTGQEKQLKLYFAPSLVFLKFFLPSPFLLDPPINGG